MDTSTRKDLRGETIGNPNIQVFSNDTRLKDILVGLIESSKALDARVWLDGVYTNIADEQVLGNWMTERDVYFKVEGRIDKRSVTLE